MLSRLYLLAGLSSLAASIPLSTPLTPPYPSQDRLLAPLLSSAAASEVIENSYIVVLKDDAAPHLLDAHTNFVESIHQQAQYTADALRDLDHGLRHVWNSHIKGYAGKFAPSTIDMIRTRPEVAYIEKDQMVYASNTTTQKSAPWGLARISHRKKLSFGTFTKYVHDSAGGEGVDVYVIDTGINVNHVEFEGRATWGHTMPANDVDQDGNGHGTHCAGTIASAAYGVAKGANVIAVKVLGSNGSGSMSDVVGGVVWASDHAKEKAEAARAEYKATGRTRHKGSVANMSLGGGSSRALDTAVNRAVDANMHFAVAAGNDNADACNYSPAAAENAVTVGASTIGDERAYFSNYGKCVDIFGPGLNILSTWIGSNTSTNIISGTSMASPHTAGLLAYLLSVYPSVQFNPDNAPVKEASLFGYNVLEIAAEFTGMPSYSLMGHMYSIARANLPYFIMQWFPDPIAPVETGYPTLTPKQLKTALVRLATKGALSELPEDTVNLLLFNNATSA